MCDLENVVWRGFSIPVPEGLERQAGGGAYWASPVSASNTQGVTSLVVEEVLEAETAEILREDVSYVPAAEPGSTHDTLWVGDLPKRFPLGVGRCVIIKDIINEAPDYICLSAVIEISGRTIQVMIDAVGGKSEVDLCERVLCNITVV